MAIRVINMCDSLPNTPAGHVISRQILRSSTSVGANYRAACRAKSTADFVNKLKIVEEEADETLYWLELIVETNMIPKSRLQPLLQEANEIVAITVASIKTQRQKRSKSTP